MILSYNYVILVQAASMFVVACAISFPIDEELSHNLSIIGVLM